MDQKYDIPRFCAPVDFGGWHLTVDGETTLCGNHKVKGHHLSGEFKINNPNKDCPECYRVYRTNQSRKVEFGDEGRY